MARLPLAWIPNEQQQLLLDAALQPEEIAVPAWRKWRSQVPIEAADYGSYRLLPIVYHNLRSALPDDPIITRLKLIHRTTWRANQLLMDQLARILEMLGGNGVETTLLKGCALIARYYPDYGLRIMDDVDVLVRREQAVQAIHLMQRMGWTTPLNAPEHQLDSWHAASLSKDDVNCDLHWQPFSEYYRPGMADDFWAGRQMITFHDQPTAVLDPAAQLVHILVHATVWDPTPTLRWVADAWMVIKRIETMDWIAVIRYAETYKLWLPVLDTFDYLRAHFDAPIPDSVIEALKALPQRRTDRDEYRAISLPEGYIWRPLRHWIRYSRVNAQTPLLQRLISFPAYLRSKWDLTQKPNPEP